MSIGIAIGLLIGGVLAGLLARNQKPRLDYKAPTATPHSDPLECHWCDRRVELPEQNCTAICDHDLDWLALNHTDPVCRETLQALDYPFKHPEPED